MMDENELYRFEVIVYKDKNGFTLSFPLPHPELDLPMTVLGEEGPLISAAGLKLKGSPAVLTILCEVQSSTEKETPE